MAPSTARTDVELDEVTDGDAWRAHALEELLPLWHEHAPDEERGAFHPTLSRRWEPTPPRDRLPAMVSRQVFAFATGYLLSGADRHLEQARRGADYLLERAWDDEHGGWYDRLTPDGEPAETTKSVELQLYTNVGLTRYYLVTGDERALEAVYRSLDIRRTHGRDERHGGYYQRLTRDLRVADDGKNKHAHYGYVGSLTLNLFLATGDEEVLAWQRELCDLSLERQTDDEGWVYGFDSEYDRRWRLSPATVDGERVLSVGAQLTAALALLRLYHQTGEERYLDHGRRVAANVDDHAWDERGFFWDRLSRATLEPLDGAGVAAWVQMYGCFLQLQLYDLTGEERHLERFRAAERFYLENLVDAEHGGVFPSVDAEGNSGENARKAAAWNTAYHEVEHAALASLYLDLYVDGEPAVLHFRLDGGDGGVTHRVCPVDDPRVGIGRVTVDGESWPRYDSEARTVTLPPGSDLSVAVTLTPVRR